MSNNKTSQGNQSMSASTINLVIFQVGPVPCAVDSNSVLTVIEPPPHITAIPGSNAFRPGLFSYSTRTVAVYDVRTKFNLPTEQRGKIILSEINGQLFGFWVDCIQEIVGADKGKSQILPAECPKELFESLFILKDQLVFKTNFEALAKAQVSTQTQKFIAKLVSEEKEEPAKEQAQVKQLNNITKPHAQTSLNAHSEEQKNKHTKATYSGQSDIKQNEKTVTTQSTTPSPTRFTTETEKPVVARTEKPVATHKTKIPAIQVKSNTLHRPTSAIKTPDKRLQTRTPTASTNKIQSQVTKRPEQPISTVNTLSKPNNSQNSSNNNTDSSGISGLVFFSLFLIILTGSLYWFIYDEPVTQRKNKLTKNILKQKIIEPPHLVENENKFSDNIEKSASLENTNVIDHDNTYQELAADELIDSNINETNTAFTEIEPENTDNTQDTEETANIQKSDNTIIITLSGSNARLNNQKNDIVDNQSFEDSPLKTEADSIIENNVTTEAKSGLENIAQKEIIINIENKTTSAQDNITEVIHIVVKGDTLWHIAKRYIHNPFRYNELARLSKIKNPDLIYPGNKVIIRIKKTTTKS